MEFTVGTNAESFRYKNYLENPKAKKDTAIKLFESKQVRTVWDNGTEKWYFSIVDVIEILTGSERPRKYWGDLKAKLKNEGSQLSEKIGQLKVFAYGGENELATDCSQLKYCFLIGRKILCNEKLNNKRLDTLNRL